MLAHSMLEGVRISSMHPTQFSSGDVIADRRADYARMRGEDPSATNYVVGIRFWF